REGDVLSDLQKAGVKNIPPVIDHQDVCRLVSQGPPDSKDLLNNGSVYVGDVQRTTTRDFVGSWWVCHGGHVDALRQKVVTRIHYRLLLGIAGFDLLHMTGTNELLHGAYDAFRALRDAYKIGHRLHRDVTPGNIVLYNDPNDKACTPLLRKGYLIDWDQSCTRSPHPESSFDRYEPSLTWQFASLGVLSGHNRLKSPELRHDITDDMESMFYTVLYCALLRSPHDLSSQQLVRIFTGMFDVCQSCHNKEHGGQGKAANKSVNLFTGGVVWASRGMTEWIDSVNNLLTSNSAQEWNLNTLDTFWRTFLERKPDLPRGDCFRNVFEEDIYIFSHRAPYTVTGTSIPATISAHSKLKRGVPGSLSTGAAGQLQAKRARHAAGKATNETTLDDVDRSDPPLLLHHNQLAHSSSSTAGVSYATAPPITLYSDVHTSPSHWAGLGKPASGGSSLLYTQLPPQASSPAIYVHPPQATVPATHLVQANCNMSTSIAADKSDAKRVGRKARGPRMKSKGKTKADLTVKAPRPLRISQALTPQNLCKQDYLSTHPDGTAEGFVHHWETLSEVYREKYKTLSKDLKLQRKAAQAAERRVGDNPPDSMG
ncbi:hypothetical protein C8Q78DRAFT_831127, partial [Trametes maxima]